MVSILMKVVTVVELMLERKDLCKLDTLGALRSHHQMSIESPLSYTFILLSQVLS